MKCLTLVPVSAVVAAVAGAMVWGCAMPRSGAPLLSAVSAGLPRSGIRDYDRVVGPRSIYGVPFGATEEEAVNAIGKPTAIVELTYGQRAYLYGKTHALIFAQGRLFKFLVDDALFE